MNDHKETAMMNMYMSCLMKTDVKLNTIQEDDFREQETIVIFVWTKELDSLEAHQSDPI